MAGNADQVRVLSAHPKLSANGRLLRWSPLMRDTFQRTWSESTDSHLLAAGLRRAGSSRIFMRAVAQ